MQKGVNTYHQVRGATYVLGYVTESGEKIPVRTFPAEFMDPVGLKNQLRQIQEQYCSEGLTDIISGARMSHRVRTPSGKEIVLHAARASEAKKKGKIIKSWDTPSGEEPDDDALKEGYREDSNDNYRKMRKTVDVIRKNMLRGDRPNSDLNTWKERFKNKSDRAREDYINSAILPGGKERRSKKIDRDRENMNEAGPLLGTSNSKAIADKMDQNRKKLTQAAQNRSKKKVLKEDYSRSLEHAINSYSLPRPTHDEDDDFSHEGFVLNHDDHFKKHLANHGHEGKLTTKERQIALAHRHLSERGHIAASRHQIADLNLKNGVVQHAREKLASAVYGKDKVEPKLAGIMMQKLNSKIRDDHESRPNAPIGAAVGFPASNKY